MSERRPDPTLAQIQANYVASVEPWLREGFVVLFQPDFQARFDVCLACQWFSEGRDGLGFCEHPRLNCRRHKPWLAGNHCPIERWPEMPIQFLEFPHRP
jgi:hypothetical protein